MKLVAVTACPTGIAHTYMAAEKLRMAAEELGVELKVETRGSAGIADELTEEDIRLADAVILAVSVSVDKSRFAGKIVVEAPIAEAIRRPAVLIRQAEAMARANQDSAVPQDEAAAELSNSGRDDAPKTEADQPAGGGASEWLKPVMTGMSYVIPFLMIGGIFTFLHARWNIPVFEAIGDAAWTLAVPVFTGFVAYSVADRPGIAAGATAGLVLALKHPGAGLLGGLAGGLLAGYAAKALKAVKLPGQLSGLMPVFFVPLISSLAAGYAMLAVLGAPLAKAQDVISSGMQGMPLAARLALGMLIGAMLAYDLGGPVNKIAYFFGLMMMAGGVFEPQAASMAAGMVPSLAVALAALAAPQKYSDKERKAGKSAWLYGISYVAEGALPFLSRDPKKVKAALVIGGATAGGLSMAFGLTLPAPHGGLFVLPFVSSPPLFLAAVAAGMLAGAVTLNLLKREAARSR